jgi:EmrB/QacA subfamily drug resistance transporter
MLKNIDNRWFAFVILCLGTLMQVLDTTIVNVALPSIREDLHFSQSSLAWVINAYLLTFGGFLLLGGRLGDLYGQRRLFIIGIIIFTIASLVCGISQTQAELIIARAVQGFGGALSTAVALSLVMNLFTKPDERARAMGYFGFIAAGGGAIGVLLGGVLTNSFDWHWNFLVNIPIGIIVILFSLKLLPTSHTGLVHKHLDIGGAVTITSSLLLAIYAIVNGVVWLLAISFLLLGIFLWIEKHVSAPLMPLSLFKLRNLSVANIVAVFLAAGMFAWFFLSALYLQLVLHYSPLQVGLSFLSANIIMAAFSFGLSAKLVMRFGIKKPLVFGLSFAAVGLLLFVRAPVDGNFFIDVLPSMILLGLGAGAALNPMFLVAMNGVPKNESGLASGIVNTSFMMGGSLGLAILAAIAAVQTSSLLASGSTEVVALNGGYHAAFFVGAIFTGIAAFLSYAMLRV